MTYKARLPFTTRTPGVFNWSESVHEWQLPTGNIALLEARHADSLVLATDFHIDAVGFESAEDARVAGEELRSALQLANIVFGLRLSIPLRDQKTKRTTLGAELKESIERKLGASPVDSIFGVSVLEEGQEFEISAAAGLSAKPSNSEFILEATSKFWGLGDCLDEPSKIACELLTSAESDSSPRGSFLITYLSLEVLLQPRRRSIEAIAIVERLAETVRNSRISDVEKKHLLGALGSLKKTSTRSEIERLVNTEGGSSRVVNGEKLGEFLNACYKLRQKLAHPPSKSSVGLPQENELEERRVGLREVIRDVVWIRNQLPRVSIDRPADVATVSEQTVMVFQ